MSAQLIFQAGLEHLVQAVLSSHATQVLAKAATGFLWL